MVMSVSGGAVFPPIQGAIADALGTPKSQCIPMIGYFVVMIYGLFFAEPVGKKKVHRGEVGEIHETFKNQVHVTTSERVDRV